MTKRIDTYAPDCCLCARNEPGRRTRRCAHAGPHQYCTDHQARIDANTHQPLCHATARNTILPDDAHPTCPQWAIKGMTVCRAHGAGTKVSRAAAAKRVKKIQAIAAAEVVRRNRAFPVGSDPLKVLRFCLDASAFWVDAWLTEIQRISNGQEGYLIGWNHLGDQAIDVAYQCYTDALDRAAKFAKLCLDAGIEERQTRVREAELALLDKAVTAMCAELGIDETVARPVIGKHLRALTA
jgi:hypothetical protein